MRSPSPEACCAVAGVFDAVLGVLILAEDTLGHGLGIDQLFVKAYITGANDVPGRMAVSTAVCLTLTGAGLLVWGPWRPRRRPAALAAAGSVIAAVAVEATFGYATGNPAAYGWTPVTAMAFLTAVTMLILALSLLSAAWRDSRTRHTGLPRWLPMPAGALALGLGVWLAIDGRAVAEGHISAVTFTAAASVVGLVMAGLVMLVVWLAQHSDGRRRVAVAEVTRRSEAELAAREGEQRLFQFLDALPVAVFIAARDGQPYYANEEAERVLSRGVVPGVGGAALAEVYHVFASGTDRACPVERLAINRAARGLSSHDDDLEIHRPDGVVIPLEVWGRPVYGAGGKVDYAIAAFADMSERNARETGAPTDSPSSWRAAGRHSAGRRGLAGHHGGQPGHHVPQGRRARGAPGRRGDPGPERHPGTAGAAAHRAPGTGQQEPGRLYLLGRS
jgi:PAS domain-containing protein